MNLEKNIALWSPESTHSDMLQGDCYLRLLISHFRRNRKHVLVRRQDLFKYFRNPDLIPQEWLRKRMRVYSLNPESLVKTKSGFVYCLCLNLLNPGVVKRSWHALDGLHFDLKDHVAYHPELISEG